MEITGKILFISETVDVSKKTEPFLTRSFALDTSVEINGTLYASCAGFQVIQDKCQLLDKFNLGDEVTVQFSIKSTTKANDKITPTEKNPNCLSVFTNLNAYGITLKTSANTAANSTTSPTETNIAAAQAAQVDDDLPF